MPEVPLCEHCTKPIDTETEQFVIPNKQIDRRENWFYYHLECYKPRNKSGEDVED
jgi:hypothetical protein